MSCTCEFLPISCKLLQKSNILGGVDEKKVNREWAEPISSKDLVYAEVDYFFSPIGAFYVLWKFPEVDGTRTRAS